MHATDFIEYLLQQFCGFRLALLDEPMPCLWTDHSTIGIVTPQILMLPQSTLKTCISTSFGNEPPDSPYQLRFDAVGHWPGRYPP